MGRSHGTVTRDTIGFSAAVVAVTAIDVRMTTLTMTSTR
jgi:hypothetical protein